MTEAFEGFATGVRAEVSWTTCDLSFERRWWLAGNSNESRRHFGRGQTSEANFGDFANFKPNCYEDDFNFGSELGVVLTKNY